MWVLARCAGGSSACSGACLMRSRSVSSSSLLMLRPALSNVAFICEDKPSRESSKLSTTLSLVVLDHDRPCECRVCAVVGLSGRQACCSAGSFPFLTRRVLFLGVEGGLGSWSRKLYVRACFELPRCEMGGPGDGGPLAVWKEGRGRSSEVGVPLSAMEAKDLQRRVPLGAGRGLARGIRPAAREVVRAGQRSCRCRCRRGW